MASIAEQELRLKCLELSRMGGYVNIEFAKKIEAYITSNPEPQPKDIPCKALKNTSDPRSLVSRKTQSISSNQKRRGGRNQNQ